MEVARSDAGMGYHGGSWEPENRVIVSMAADYSELRWLLIAVTLIGFDVAIAGDLAGSPQSSRVCIEGMVLQRLPK